MDYTVCKNVIDLAKTGNKYTTLLFHFTMSNNSDKVVLNNDILEAYKESKTEMIHSWIDLMTKLMTWKKIDNVTCNCDDIFINSCNVTYDKKLIVSEREDYTSMQYENLDVINKDEAINILMPTSQISIIGNGTSLTTGNNSYIIGMNDEY